MKIVDFKGNELCDLPDKPKDFDCGHKAGTIDIVCGGENVKLGRYDTETASRIVADLCKAYVGGQLSFTMPKES